MGVYLTAIDVVWLLSLPTILTPNKIMKHLSTINPTSVIALIATGLAITASVGFTGYFSYQIGAEHSVLLAVLSAMFAVSLDLMKPVALYATFQAFRSLSLGRGMIFLTLTVIAILFSVTSELSLMTMSRGDLVAKREEGIRQRNALQEQYRRWKVELGKLQEDWKSGQVKSKGVLKAELERIESKPGILINGKPCGGVYDGIVTRTHCPQWSSLKAELSKAERRDELEELIKGYSSNNAGLDNISNHSDPGAKSLSTLLYLLTGEEIDIHKISLWLSVISVLGLEVASSFGVVLLNFINGCRKVVPKVQQQKSPVMKDRVSRDFVKKLKKEGGKLEGSEREIAGQLNTSKTTLRRVVGALKSAGMLSSEANKNGSVFHLLA